MTNQRISSHRKGRVGNSCLDWNTLSTM